MGEMKFRKRGARSIYLSTLNSQLSTLNSQLSTLNSQLSKQHHELKASSINFDLPPTPSWKISQGFLQLTQSPSSFWNASLLTQISWGNRSIIGEIFIYPQRVDDLSPHHDKIVVAWAKSYLMGRGEGNHSPCHTKKFLARSGRRKRIKKNRFGPNWDLPGFIGHYTHLWKKVIFSLFRRRFPIDKAIQRVYFLKIRLYF